VYLAIESQKLALPTTASCVTWSSEARKVLGVGKGAWRDLQQVAALALQHFHAKTGHDAAVWFADEPLTDADNRPGTLIAMYFGTDAKATKDDLAAFEPPIAQSGLPWSADGVHERPDTAFPSLGVRKGTLYQVWEDGPDPTATSLTSGFSSRRKLTAFSRATEDDFLPWVKHAIGVFAVPDPEKARNRRQLEVAFAYRIAERIVAADGVVDAAEQAFLERMFTADELGALWLDDPDLREAMARTAEKDLGAQLGHHQKLALLSTFYAACYADGRVELRELKVLKDACAALGLDNQEVVASLKKLW
jgi:tellurite resistance protein